MNSSNGDHVHKTSLFHRLFISALLGLGASFLGSGSVAIFISEFSSRNAPQRATVDCDWAWIYLGRFVLEFPMTVWSRIVNPFTKDPHSYTTWGEWGFSIPICILSWSIVGILLGLLFFSWSRRPFRLFIRLHLFIFLGLLLLWGIYGVDSWLHPDKPNMTAPRNYHPPCLEIPSGFQHKLLTEEELRQFQKGERATVFENERERDEFSLSQTVGNKIYQIHYSFSYAWPYIFQVREEGQNDWRTLGPFLPGFGATESISLNVSLSSNIPLIFDGRLQWLVQQVSDEFKNENAMAHKQGAVENSPIWLCSIPIDLYEKDSDNDGLNEMEEAARLTRPDQADTDGDGISDKEDRSPHGWFRNDRGISLEAQKMVKERLIPTCDTFPPIVWFNANPPWQVESGTTTVFTLDFKAIDEIQRRSGMNRFHVEFIHQPYFRTYFNEAFGVVICGSTWGRLASHSNIAMYWRWPFGLWQKLFIRLFWIS